MTTREELWEKLRRRLDGGGHLKVSDPQLSDVAEVQIVPAAAGGQKETTRLTFHVPYNNTVLSLGKPSALWRTDPGIFARTLSHILLEVETEAKTFISLGKPSVFTMQPGLHGFMPQASVGYSMVTYGDAWSQSRKSHVSLSATGDAIVAADEKKVLLRANTKAVEVTGKEKVVIGSPGPVTIMAHSGVKLPGIAYQAEVDDTLPTSIDAAGSTWASNVAMAQDTTVNAAGAMLAMGAGLEEVQKESPSFAAGDGDCLGVLAASFNLMGGLGFYAEGQGSDVGITAEKAASLTGGQAASLFGGAVAGVSSLGFSSMFGNTAGVTGIAGLGLVGVAGAEMLSKSSCMVRSFGSAAVLGRKEARLESSSGWVSVASKKLTQVSSLGKTAVYGKTFASLGTDYGGIVANEEEVFIGHTTKSDDLGGTKPDYKAGITVSKTGISMQIGKAELTLTKAGAFHFKGTKAWESKVGGADAMIKPSKLLLG